MHRLLSREGLFDKKPPDGADRRRFAFRDAGELWMSDVMHGPKVRLGRSRRKTYLIAFIDDATRVVPFAAFATAENIQAFLPTFKNALIRRGLPQRLYVRQWRRLPLPSARPDLRKARHGPRPCPALSAGWEG